MGRLHQDIPHSRSDDNFARIPKAAATIGHMANMPLHVANMNKDLLTSNGFPFGPDQPYGLNLSLSDFCLFEYVKRELFNVEFELVEN
jgi:hypothetical protein